MFLVGAVIGWFVGLFAFPNILLPIGFAWPRLRQLRHDGKLVKDAPMHLLLIAPAVYLAALSGLQLFLYGFERNLSTGYGLGLGSAFFNTLWNWISGRDRALMEADFADTYRVFLKDASDEPTSNVEKTQTAKQSALVVENEPAIRHLLARTLELADYSVDAVPDGEDAMGQLASTSYSLMIVATNLPDMHGRVLIQYVRRFAPSTRIVALGAANNEEARHLGAMAHIPQPFRITEVLIAAGVKPHNV